LLVFITVLLASNRVLMVFIMAVFMPIAVLSCPSRFYSCPSWFCWYLSRC
jgi:hypothetical protein